MHSLKHDLEKHFIAIRTTAEQNNDKSIIEYVDSIINKYYTYTHKTVFTNNKIFNAVINTRLEICQHKKIKTTIKVENDILNNINDEDIRYCLEIYLIMLLKRQKKLRINLFHWKYKNKEHIFQFIWKTALTAYLILN